MYVCIYVYIYIYIYIYYKQTHTHAQYRQQGIVYIYMIYIHTHTHTDVREASFTALGKDCIHTCIHTYIHKNIQTCERLLLQLWERLLTEASLKWLPLCWATCAQAKKTCAKVPLACCRMWRVLEMSMSFMCLLACSWIPRRL